MPKLKKKSAAKKTTKAAMKAKPAIATPASTVDPDDPEYLIAYDVKRCKVGCVLIQAVHGTVPSKLFHDYFGDGSAWTVDARGCQVYPIRKSQLPLLATRTNFDREDF